MKKIIYVRVQFENTSKYYNYYSFLDVEVGDMAIVDAPSGLALVKVTHIVKRNKIAHQPLVSILGKEALSSYRSECNSKYARVQELQRAIDDKVEAIKEDAMMSHLKSLDPSLAKMIDELAAL